MGCWDSAAEGQTGYKFFSNIFLGSGTATGSVIKGDAHGRGGSSKQMEQLGLTAPV